MPISMDNFQILQNVACYIYHRWQRVVFAKKDHRPRRQHDECAAGPTITNMSADPMSTIKNTRKASLSAIIIRTSRKKSSVLKANT